MTNLQRAKRASKPSAASAPPTRAARKFNSLIERKNARKFIVVFTLIGVLSLTSVLLLAISGDPMRPGAVASLYAVGSPTSLDALFQTAVPAAAGRWKSIYIHQSKSLAGNARTMAQAADGADGMPDHFLIGNGDGCVDGEIQEGHRWNQQLSALAPTTDIAIDGSCISICLIGDLDQAAPTPTQMRRLEQLAGTLQARYGIPAAQVLWVKGSSTAAAIGRAFPAASFHEHLRNWSE